MTDPDADLDDDFAPDADTDPDDDAKPRLTELGAAAETLRDILLRETQLANKGGLSALSSAVRAKPEAWARFNDLSGRLAADQPAPNVADRAALESLVAAAKENALILDAVKATINDFADRLRTALTASADPGIYGPRTKGPRHTMAARIDRRI